MKKEQEYKIPRQDITDIMLDGPVDPIKTYGKAVSGRKTTVKKPVRRTPAVNKGGK
jgi:hypothetical protein